jgi:preprotein translocase subunit Sec63
MLYEIFKKLNTVRSRKRPFAKWAKTEKSEDIECIKQVFSISDSKAREILRLLSKEEIQQIKKQIETGGLRK